MASLTTSSQRYLEIDLLRTIALALMVLYHLIFDLAYFHGVPVDPTVGGWMILERVTAHLFLLVSGASAAISYARSGPRPFREKGIRRFLILLTCGCLVSVVTYVLLGDAYVRFGILHLLAVTALLLPFLLPLGTWNALIGIVALWLGDRLSTILLSTSLLLPLGIRPVGFVTVDYFPLFPWLGTILIGSAIGHLLYVRGWLHMHLPDTPLTRRLTEPGRHSLLLYLVHQPILLALLWIVGYPWGW